MLNSTLSLVKEDEDELEVYGCLGSSNHKLAVFINTHRKPVQTPSVPSENLGNCALTLSLTQEIMHKPVMSPLVEVVQINITLIKA